MSTDKYPMRYALLAAALMQIFPASADAAKKDNDEEGICEDCPDYSGKSGWVEAGIGLQSNDSEHFGRYTGRAESGATFNLGGAFAYRNKDGTYLDGKALDLGLASREIEVLGGKQGKYEIAIEYDQISNVRALDAQTPFQQQGEQLVLPSGWVPGGLTSNMPTLAGSLQRTTLKTERDRLGGTFKLIPDKNWEISGHYRHEEKEGVRDMGATFGFAQTSILPDPFKYETDDFGLAVDYQAERYQVRVTYNGSLFNNHSNAITWDNPFVQFAGQEQGRIADAPDNQFHQIGAQIGYQLTDKTRLGAQFARGRMTQDEAFLPYTINPLVLASTAALPAASLDGRVDTTLAKFEINSRPSHRLRLDASYTFNDRDNKTPLNTYQNVVTDVYLSPTTYQNKPFSFEQRLLRAKAGYRFANDIDLSGGYDHDRMERTLLQVEETEDHTVWANLRLQPMESVQATLKYAHSERDASPYTAQAADPWMKRFNQTDRSRDKVGIGVAVNKWENMAVNLDLDWYKEDYPKTVQGLTEGSGITVTPSLSYQFNERVSASAYYSHDRLNSEQAGWEGLVPPPAPGASNWLFKDSNRTGTLGVSVDWKSVTKKLDLGMDLVHSRLTGKLEYQNEPDLPSIKSNLTALGIHGVYRWKDNMSVRAGLWYERYKESDWAKDASVTALPTLLSLGVAPQDADTVLLTVALRYEFK